MKLSKPIIRKKYLTIGYNFELNKEKLQFQIAGYPASEVAKDKFILNISPKLG